MSSENRLPLFQHMLQRPEKTEASPAGAEIRRREPMFKTSRRERTKAA
jgi:hypothetical protein